ncbi:chromosome partitioning protein ParB [Patescibacteria group bacterium]|nr:MAG: chromosome partitioning protein ParB [Patescibacteria group bacterium]
MDLNEKQQAFYNKALELYGDKLLKKNDVVLKIIKGNGKIDFLPLEKITEASFVADVLNDIIYDPTSDNLFTRYIIPPFSILNTNAGEWKNRRSKWDAYLGSSLVGRKEGLAYGSWDNEVKGKMFKVREDDNGTSQFDAMLCELLFKWFGFKGCKVLDPYAGGHTRGTVATKIGYDYTGIDLSKEQVEANRKRADELGLKPNWINDDAQNIELHVQPNTIDLVLTCPPYGDLEQYTDDPKDLSNMEYADFRKAHWKIIEKALTCLKDNRFAVYVVGDFRDEKGFYRGFTADTIKAFEHYGVPLYNHLVLLNAVGTASMRANGQFRNRKMAKIHQDVLVFYKGDPTKIQETYGDMDASLPLPQIEQKSLF